ncbi:MAG: hypothetical protein COX20_00485 [Desulfobacterales bacterium CG23_combo_of_CG06-09_8_20_14_all_52_9]|nr:MAG: hypothetical protein COX20_00485 [Desulfobacterales bacterium CG23_combo_of_CG06-09_8_20_14_all_52_9]
MEKAVFGRPYPADDLGRHAFDAVKKTLFPVPPHLDRTPICMQRGQGQQRLHRCTVFPAESTAQIRGDHPDPFYGKTQRFGHFLPIPMGRLGGYRYRNLSVGIHLCKAGFGLKISMFLPRKDESTGNNRLAIRKR